MAHVPKVSSASELFVFVRSGQVIDCQTSHRTHVSGGGGANNSNVHISSSTTEQLRMFLREADGGELEVEFDNPGIGVRQGNRISVVYAGHQKSRTGYPVGMVNHDTGRWMVSRRQLQRVPALTNLTWGCLLVPVGMIASGFVGMLALGALGTILNGTDRGAGDWVMAGFVLGPVFTLVASLLLLISIGNRNTRRTRMVEQAVNAEIRRLCGER